MVAEASKTINVQNIIRATGFVPLDPNSILSNLDIHLKPPTYSSREQPWEQS